MNYIGLPYQPRGCWELVRLFYREEFGIELPGYADEYAKLSRAEQREIATLIRAERSEWQQVVDERRGDAVLLRITGEPSHIGVVVEPGKMLHVFRGNTSCIESYRSPKWARRVDSFWRHRCS